MLTRCLVCRSDPSSSPSIIVSMRARATSASAEAVAAKDVKDNVDDCHDNL